jgi:hypothetical protein
VEPVENEFVSDLATLKALIANTQDKFLKIYNYFGG